jgi:hypothetical protein
MPRKIREPFAFAPEPDGSVAVAAFPHGSRAKTPIFHHVGWIRSAPDGVLSSTTFEEMQDYSMWVRHHSADEAISSLTTALLAIASNPKVPDEIARVRSLERSLELAPRFSFRATEALASAARGLLREAIANMLRVSTYEDVMRVVSDVLAADVIDS